MDFQGVKPDLVKFEMRQTSGTPAWQKEINRPGAFGRILSGTGRILGATALPLGFLFPPAALAAAGMYGVSSLGDQIQVKNYQRATESASNRSQGVSFPGLSPEGMSLTPAASTPVSPYNQQVIDVLFSRDAVSSNMSQAL